MPKTNEILILPNAVKDQYYNRSFDRSSLLRFSVAVAWTNGNLPSRINVVTTPGLMHQLTGGDWEVLDRELGDLFECQTGFGVQSVNVDYLALGDQLGWNKTGDGNMVGQPLQDGFIAIIQVVGIKWKSKRTNLPAAAFAFVQGGDIRSALVKGSVDKCDRWLQREAIKQIAIEHGCKIALIGGWDVIGYLDKFSIGPTGTTDRIETDEMDSERICLGFIEWPTTGLPLDTDEMPREIQIKIEADMFANVVAPDAGRFVEWMCCRRYGIAPIRATIVRGAGIAGMLYEDGQLVAPTVQ